MRNFFIIFVFVLFLAAGFFINYFFIEQNKDSLVIEKHRYSTVDIDLLAVMDNGEGLTIPLTVSTQEGTGDLYLDVDDPTIIGDTQQSARIAAVEAQRVTGIDFGKVDVLVSMDTTSRIVSGSSAGAAMTVAMIASILNKHLKDDIALTGTITLGGEVGPVGGILEKAKAAKAVGKKVLLVPKGESIMMEPVQNCKETLGSDSYAQKCTVTYEKTDIAAETGIKVEEVSTIEEVLKRMLI